MQVVTGLVPGADYSVTRTIHDAGDTVVVTPGGPLMADVGGVLEIVNSAAPLQTILVVRGDIRLQLRIPLIVGQSLSIETSNDLKTWSAIGAPQSGANGLEFDDVATVSPGVRFYRAVSR
jgi:hypothetical protein